MVPIFLGTWDLEETFKPSSVPSPPPASHARVNVQFSIPWEKISIVLAFLYVFFAFRSFSPSSLEISIGNFLPVTSRRLYMSV